MLTQLLQVMSPDLIIQAIRANPKVVLDTLQKFDTFKLLGESLNQKQQITLSNNAGLLNDFLRSEQGKQAAFSWAEAFTNFVEEFTKPPVALDEVTILRLREDQIRREIEDKIRLEMEAKLRSEIEPKIRAEIESQSKQEIQNKLTEAVKPKIIYPT